MTPDDSAAFRTAMGRVCVVFGKEADEIRLGVYWDALRDLPIEAVIAALRVAEREAKWFPVPAVIREYAGATRQDAAVTAWEALGQAIRSFGYYRQPELPIDVLTAANAVYGSWQSACAQMPARHERGYEDHRRRFLLAYALREHRAALPSSVTVRQLKAAKRC